MLSWKNYRSSLDSSKSSLIMMYGVCSYFSKEFELLFELQLRIILNFEKFMYHILGKKKVMIIIEQTRNIYDSVSYSTINEGNKSSILEKIITVSHNSLGVKIYYFIFIPYHEELIVYGLNSVNEYINK